MVHQSLYSSRTEEWETPPALFERLDRIFGFRLDACASPANRKCETWFSAADNALERSWAEHGRVWLNPPYGRRIAGFMRKAFEESQKGALVVALVPARTDTLWWHEWVNGKADIVFLKGRLKYLDENRRERSPAPFPSALVVYQPDLDGICNRRAAEPAGAGGGGDGLAVRAAPGKRR
ncbi:phage N-6-adenine-methyltransferase [Afifella pfennigii]|uniref:phage N-6-adenine-methyltransferase n=1 Tax=Afifella pfennigii TaxID=209897 RepID=UPI0009FE9E52|nr:phage N-6-adenine-methyltransferase [Afifella pfennigii]